MTPVTRRMAIRAWRDLGKEYKTRAVPAASMLGWFLKRYKFRQPLIGMGLENVKEFLESRFISLGRWTLTPYRIGSRKASYLTQLLTAAHEHQHRVQMLADGLPRFVKEYFRSPGIRTVHEGKALCAEADALFALGYSFKRIRQNIAGQVDEDWGNMYVLSRAEADLALEFVDQNLRKLNSDRFITEAGASTARIIRAMT